VILTSFLIGMLFASDGSTPLHRAAYDDDVQKASALLAAGADVTAVTDLGVTPLWAACENGSVTMVETLLAAGANPNVALLKGETPLMIASRAGAAPVVELLLRKGADPNARGPRKQTALMWAAAQKHSGVVKVLLAHRADIHARSEVWSQMMAVPPHGHPAYNRMIPHGGDTALLFAARAGDLESARLLVAAGANVNDKDAWGVSAAMFAAHSGFRDLLVFLLQQKANANEGSPGFTALHAAIMHRDEQMVAALLAHGADPNAPITNWTPTRRSSRDFHFPPALIGARPFWLAARFSTPAVMRLLAKHGADARFVHRAEYLNNDLQPRKETTNALMAALGMGTGSTWVQPPREQREAQVLEAVRLAVELGIETNAAALAQAKALKYERVVNYLQSVF